MNIKYKVEWKMNGSHGILSKEYDDLGLAKLFYNKKVCNCTTKSVKLVKCEVLEYLLK